MTKRDSCTMKGIVRKVLSICILVVILAVTLYNKKENSSRKKSSENVLSARDHRKDQRRERRRRTREQQQQQQQEEEPKLIIHIGPHKTGTSTIQGVLTKLDYWYDILHDDNLYYMGKLDGMPRYKNVSDYSNDHYATKVKHLCLEDVIIGATDNVSPECMERFNYTVGLVKDHYQQGHNIIVSDEDIENCLKFAWGEQVHIGPMTSTPLEEEEYAQAGRRMKDFFVPLMGDYWPNHIHVMFVYRRFYEWDFSKYKQQAGSFLDTFRNKQHESGWDHPKLKAGFRTYPFTVAREYNDRKSHSRANSDIYFHRQLPQVLHTSQISMINLHETNDFVTDFVCHGIPINNTTKSCEFVKNHREFFPNANGRHANELHYAFIAREAHLRLGEEFTSCYTPHEVFEAVANFYNTLVLSSSSNTTNATTTDPNSTKTDNLLFLNICPSSKEQYWLRTKTIEDEIELFPEFHFHQGGKEAIEEEFQKAIDSREFCTVDLDSLFSDTDWKQFFQTMIKKCTSEEG